MKNNECRSVEVAQWRSSPSNRRYKHKLFQKSGHGESKQTSLYQGKVCTSHVAACKTKENIGNTRTNDGLGPTGPWPLGPSIIFECISFIFFSFTCRDMGFTKFFIVQNLLIAFTMATFLKKFVFVLESWLSHYKTNKSKQLYKKLMK